MPVRERADAIDTGTGLLARIVDLDPRIRDAAFRPKYRQDFEPAIACASLSPYCLHVEHPCLLPPRFQGSLSRSLPNKRNACRLDNSGQIAGISRQRAVGWRDVFPSPVA